MERCASFNRYSRLTAALLVGLSAMVLAQTDTANERWQQLDAAVIEAYRAGNYAAGIQVAEEARELARTTFRPPDLSR